MNIRLTNHWLHFFNYAENNYKHIESLNLIKFMDLGVEMKIRPIKNIPLSLDFGYMKRSYFHENWNDYLTDSLETNLFYLSLSLNRSSSSGVQGYMHNIFNLGYSYGLNPEVRFNLLESGYKYFRVSLLGGIVDNKYNHFTSIFPIKFYYLNKIINKIYSLEGKITGYLFIINEATDIEKPRYGEIELKLIQEPLSFLPFSISLGIGSRFLLDKLKNDKELISDGPFLSISLGIPGTGKLKGKVCDSHKNPLAGANILIPGTNIGTISDQNGDFYLRRIPSKINSIKAMQVGYEGYQINNLAVFPNQTESVDIYLNPAKWESDMLTFTSDRKYKNLKYLSGLLVMVSGVVAGYHYYEYLYEINQYNQFGGDELFDSIASKKKRFIAEFGISITFLIPYYWL